MLLQDEQRVVIWLALRDMHRPDLQQGIVRVAEIEDGCCAFWAGAGVYRAVDTWVRAFRRAKSHGLLGAVSEHREPGTRWYWVRYSRSPAGLLEAVGPTFSGIAHGKRKPAAYAA